MKNKHAFTYIELIVVIAIIGILAAFGYTTYPGTQKTARDTKRRSDLKQYQTALERYALTHSNYYPSLTNQTTCTDLCAYLGIPQCATDPKAGENVCISGMCNYYYQSNGTGSGEANASQYVLYSMVEKSPGYWVYCSNGTSGVAPASTIFLNGSCPL